MAEECGTCAESVKKNSKCVFCLLFGIMIGIHHSGCLYFRKQEDEECDRQS